MGGLSSSALATGERRYLSAMKGRLQRLAADGQSWAIVRQLDRARFVRRMVPLANSPWPGRPVPPTLI